MKLSAHADHTEKVVGLRAEDIHKWIDGFFDRESFDAFLASGRLPPDFDPYAHRRFRHCREALEDAYREFEGQYTREQIRAVFETHVRDDYGGYIPNRVDFENGTFKEKYHEREEAQQQERIFSKAELEEYFAGKSHACEQQQERAWMSAFNVRILLPTVLTVVLFVGAIILVVMPLFRGVLLNQKKQTLLELTASAASIVEYYVEQARAGELSTAEAQARAAGELRSMRYGKDNKDYFWITDMHPRMVMHPYRPDLHGHDLTEYRDAEDASGMRLFMETVRIVREQGAGFLKYHWQWKDKPGQAVLKISYVRGVPEWAWIVGTGIYVDDIEREMARLNERLFVTFSYITLGLFVFMLYIVRQSRRIEHRRQRAERGLIEAKERYRALVESSNEGYLLEVGGEPVYCNRPLERLSGYTEEALLAGDFREMLFPPSAANEEARRYFGRIFEGQTTLAEFTGQMKGRNGLLLDVSIRTSRLFFSRSNGHVIAIRPIVRTKDMPPPESSGRFGSTEVMVSEAQAEAAILSALREGESVGAIIQALNGLPPLLARRFESCSEAAGLRQLAGRVYDATLERILALSLAEVGEPPCAFAFLSLGSNARYEMTLFSDQDNALVFDCRDRDALERHRLYFLRLGNVVCGKLDAAGFPYCQGGVMASNPRWCLSLEEWQEKLTAWITCSTPEALMEVNIAFDVRFSYGERALAEALLEHTLSVIGATPQFLLHYAHHALHAKVPVSALGPLKTDFLAGVDCVNLKDCLQPLVLFARLYAFKHGVRRHTTLERVAALAEAGVLHGDSARDILQALDSLWRLRFHSQIRAHAALRRVDDQLAVETLGTEDLRALRDAFSQIALCRQKMMQDFPLASQW